MSLERHDWNEGECNSDANTKYINAYMDWIVPQVYGEVCDVGSGLGYPTLKYAEKENVTKVITNDKFFDEEKTTKHEKIVRFIETTEEFISKGGRKYDCITCTEHVEHLTPESQGLLLKWVTKHLKNNGIFLGSMPDCERSGNPYHLKEYTHKQWEFILKQFFRDVEVVVLIPNLLYVWRATSPL